MSKSDDEKAALQSGSGGAGLPSLAGGAGGGIRVPRSAFDKLTTTITPEGLSAQEFDAYESLDSGGFTPNGMPSNLRNDYAGASVVEAVGKMPSAGDRFGPGGLTTLTGGDFSVGPDFGSLGIGMGDMGGLDPTLPQFQQEKTFGQKAKDSIKGFLGKLARIHPATRNAAFALDFVKGLQNAENPQEFVKGVMGQLAMRKVGGNLGLSGVQKQGIGGLMNMAQGKQNLGQTLGSLGTSAAFRSAAPSIFKSAYQSGGMNGVYAAAAALQMAQRGAQQKVSGALGPGGGG